MKKLLLTATTLILMSNPAAAQPAGTQEMLERVYLDAQVIRRVAEVAHRDLPQELLLRIIEQDIELLRGRQNDGTYQYAHFEPIESGRVSEGFSVRPQQEDERMDRNQFRAKNVFKLIVDIPTRRFVLARNRDVFLDRIEVSYDDQEGRSKQETFTVNERLEAGEQMEFELPEVASDAIATVYAQSDTKSANMALIFVKAELVDNANSPWFGIIQSAKLLHEAVGRGDQTAMQSLASSMAERIRTSAGRPIAEPRISLGSPADPDGSIAVAEIDTVPVLQIYLQLERIKDLLEGPPSERDEAMGQLEELIRDLRSSALDAAQRR